MPKEINAEPSIDPNAFYEVVVSRPFYHGGVGFKPTDVQTVLSGALVLEFKDCLTSFNKVEE